jgi:hypothetical protein
MLGKSAGTDVAVFVTMLRLDRAQRHALSESVREQANVVAGVFVLGQFIGDELALMTPTVSALLFMWTLVVVVGIVVLLDWHTRRKDRRSKQPQLPF